MFIKDEMEGDKITIWMRKESKKEEGSQKRKSEDDSTINKGKQ